MSATRLGAQIDPRVPDPQEITYRGIEAVDHDAAADHIEEVLIAEDFVFEQLLVSCDG
jgi:hypothetical protein